MKKIVLDKITAIVFCNLYNDGDWLSLDFLKSENNKHKFLDYETECLLYAVMAMNTILNDYLWVKSLDAFQEETKPNFNESWLLDMEEKYFNSKRKLLNRFSNVGFNEDTGELEYRGQ